MRSTTRPSSTAAPSAKRPCGLEARTTFALSSGVWSRASRWMVCPSGKGALLSGRGLLHGWQGAGRLVLRQHPDAAGVALVAAVVRAQERLEDAECGGLVVHAGAEADDVGVVVLAG